MALHTCPWGELILLEKKKFTDQLEKTTNWAETPETLDFGRKSRLLKMSFLKSRRELINFGIFSLNCLIVFLQKHGQNSYLFKHMFFSFTTIENRLLALWGKDVMSATRTLIKIQLLAKDLTDHPNIIVWPSSVKNVEEHDWKKNIPR